MTVTRIASFTLPQSIAYPHGAVVTDINKNGSPEIVVIRFQFPGGQELPIPFYEIGPDGTFLNISGSIFVDGYIPVTDFGRGIISGDITGNGFDDIIIADHGFDQVPFPGAVNPVYINNGKGQLVDRSADFSKGADFTHSVAWGDLTGNGRSDIFFNNLGVDSAYIVSMDGQGEPVIDGLALPFEIRAYSSVLIADLSNIGRDQVVLGVDRNIGGSGSIILDWSGDAFNVIELPQSSFFENEIVLDIAALDLTRNGLQDLILLQTSANPFYTGFALQFLIQQPDGRFADQTSAFIDPGVFGASAAGSTWGRYLLIDDLNGNGLQDIVVEMNFPEKHKIFLQVEPGKFHQAEIDVGNLNETLVLADVTFNGRNELIVIGTNTVNIYEFDISDRKFLPPQTIVENGIYRFYNERTGVHFLTTSSDERDMIIDTMSNFRYEGVAFTSSVGQADGLAIYRFYNTRTDAHFFTASKDERDSIAADLPWFAYEGTAFYAHGEPGAHKQAVYRFYNTETNTHFYTASDNERDDVMAGLPSFKFEGVAYYVDIA